MKLKFSLLLLLISFGITSQNNINQKDLEQCIKEYSKALTQENIDLELSLMHPSLFLNSPKNSIINQYFRNQLKKDTTLLKIKNKLFIIQDISKPIKKGTYEFKIINFILIKERTFSKDFLNKNSRIDNSLKVNRFNKFNTSKREFKNPGMWVTWNKETKVGLSARNKKILVVRNKKNSKWYFISNKWWTFQYETKKNNPTGWKIKRNYKKIHYKELPFKIPNRLLKQLKKTKSY